MEWKMRNEEKYKSSKEREEAFEKYCSSLVDENSGCPFERLSCEACVFRWLEKEINNND